MAITLAQLDDDARVASFSLDAMREPRMGHAYPDSKWYKNSDASAKPGTMTYNVENFIIGHDLTAAHYLVLRDHMVMMIHATKAKKVTQHANGLYSRGSPMPLWRLKLKDDSDEEDTSKTTYWKAYRSNIQWDYLWPLWIEIHRHKFLVDSPAPLYWREPMGFSFITSTIDFIVSTSTSPTWKTFAFPYWSSYPPYRFTWKNKDLSPKKEASKPKFRSMNVKIYNETSADRPSCKIMIVQLLPEVYQPPANSNADIDITRIQIAKLTDKIRHHGFDSEEHVVQFLNPRAGNRLVPILIDKHLRYAVEALREHGMNSIKLRWTKKTTGA